MQIVVPVNMTPQEYSQKYQEVRWPVLEKCPVCGARTNPQGHGWYSRNGLPSRDLELVVMIRRLLCPVCKKTVSLLPWFLLPRFQHTARFIVESLLKKAKSYRRLMLHYTQKTQKTQ